MTIKYRHRKQPIRYGYPYRVLHYKDGVVNTWDYRDSYEAHSVYDSQTDFERCMLLHVSAVNVKLIKEKTLGR